MVHSISAGTVFFSKDFKQSGMFFFFFLGVEFYFKGQSAAGLITGARDPHKKERQLGRQHAVVCFISKTGNQPHLLTSIMGPLQAIKRPCGDCLFLFFCVIDRIRTVSIHLKGKQMPVTHCTVVETSWHSRMRFLYIAG